MVTVGYQRTGVPTISFRSVQVASNPQTGKTWRTTSSTSPVRSSSNSAVICSVSLWRGLSAAELRTGTVSMISACRGLIVGQACG